MFLIYDLMYRERDLENVENSVNEGYREGYMEQGWR
jgi:hypothetical protein